MKQILNAMLYATWQRKHRWMCHVLRHDDIGLLRDIIGEGMDGSQQEEGED